MATYVKGIDSLHLLTIGEEGFYPGDYPQARQRDGRPRLCQRVFTPPGTDGTLGMVAQYAEERWAAIAPHARHLPLAPAPQSAANPQGVGSWAEKEGQDFNVDHSHAGGQYLGVGRGFPLQSSSGGRRLRTAAASA